MYSNHITYPSKSVLRSVNASFYLVKVLEEQGIAPEQLIENTGVTLQTLHDPYGKLTQSQVLKCIENFADITNVPGVALDLGASFRLSSFGALGFAIYSSQNLGAAIDIALKYINLSYSLMGVRFCQLDSQAVIELYHDKVPQKLKIFLLERQMATALALIKELVGETFSFNKVVLSYPPPSYEYKYQRQFGCEIVFSDTKNQMYFNEQYCNKHIPSFHPLALQIHQAQCEKISDKLCTHSELEKNIQGILLNTPDSFLTMEQVAGKINVSVRTLNNRLKQENVAYRDIVKNVKKELAVEWLTTTPLTIVEIAERLGYSESSSFAHAFKRWTGSNPGSFRLEQSAYLPQ